MERVYKIYNTIINDVKDGDIILCHDLHGTTVDAMERIIPALIERGNQLVTVSELKGAHNQEYLKYTCAYNWRQERKIFS